MCRLYASVGAPGDGPPPEELLAFRGLAATGLGGPHADGWGVVGYRTPRAPQLLGKSVLPAGDDKAYEAAAAAARDHGVVLAHLRAASVGAKLLDNTHPFTRGPWAFAHNGTIRGGYAERHGGEPGANDSRALFQRVLARLGRGGDPAAALRGAVREVQEGGYPYTSLTVLLTDGAALWAAREVREGPEEHALVWRRAAGGRVVLGQEPLPGLGGEWLALPNGHLAVVGGGDVRVAPL